MFRWFSEHRTWSWPPIAWLLSVCKPFPSLTSRSRLCSPPPVGSAMSSLLSQHVLVLNRLWQAVNICTARRALTLLFQGHAQVVLVRSDGSFQNYNFNEWHGLSHT